MQTMQLTALEGRRAIHKRRGKLVILRKRIAELSAGTLERFVRRARRAVRLRETVNVLVTSSGELRVLNRRFRGKDKATDILSFPSPSEVLNRKKRMAGELAISADIARENAEQLGHSVAEEIKILVLHGILHLAGFDHEQDHGEMAREENRLRRELRLESGLIERSQVKSLSRANRLRRRPTQLTVPRRRSA
jgi:probable rRNA maturation factor